MLKKITLSTLGFVEHVMQWADPWWWVSISFCLLVLCTIHFLPLELKPENHDLSDRIFLFFRRIFLGALVGLGVLFPLGLYLAFGMAAGRSNGKAASHVLLGLYADMAMRYWGLPVAAIISGVTMNLCWHRYGEPAISQFLRKHRVKQIEDERSDVRDEVGKYQTKRFDPEKYFIPDNYFVGLGVDNKPIYIPAEIFESTGTASIAPTGFGKGVNAGVLLTQAVRRGNTVFWVDPKGDKRAPHILQAEAKRAGRPFVYLDLTPEGKGSWAPFKGGSLRDRRARLLAAFRLGATGTNADVYKTKERSIVDKILKTTDGSISALLEAAIGFLGKDDLSELREGLSEWSQISTFTSNRKRKGHSIEASLLNNAVVYVKGSITDNVIKSATRCYVSELIQEAIRLDSQRTSHLTIFTDEVRFIISNEIVDALATMREFRANMMLATQAISDLRNLEDKTIDGAALQSSVEINCQVKLIYRAGDSDTAEWGQRLSGTKYIRVAGNEKTEINRWGAEKWDKVRAFNQEEVPFFSENVFLSLPPMVTVVYQPRALPQVAFSSWINVDMTNTTWLKKEPEELNDPESAVSASPGPATPAVAPPAGAAALAVAKPAVAVAKPSAVVAKPAPSATGTAKPKMRGNPKLATSTPPATPATGDSAAPGTAQADLQSAPAAADPTIKE